MNKQKHRPGLLPERSRFSFTLIELLVVIAIIAILASLLLPALNKARASAMKVSCVADMKQVVIATFLYGDEFADYYPMGFGAGWAADPEYQWFYFLLPYTNNNKRIFVNCRMRTRPISSRLGDPNRYFSYSYLAVGANGRLFNFGYPANKYYKQFEVRLPARKLMYGDSTGDYGTTNFAGHMIERQTSNSAAYPDFCHNGMANFAMCDGHIEDGRKKYADIGTGRLLYHENFWPLTTTGLFNLQ